MITLKSGKTHNGRRVRPKHAVTVPDCVHLGAVIGSEQVDCCGARQVHGCAVHTQCIKEACKGCHDWSTHSPTPGLFSGRLNAITSLSPNSDRWQRQLRCLRSWRRIGLDIFVVNTRAELDTLRVPEWCQVVVGEQVTTVYDRPTMTINALVQAGLFAGLPFMLINSDIELAGDPALLEAALQAQDRLGIGVRYNHQPGDRSAAVREHSGLDAFLLSPELAATVPEAPFGIGKPVWDYWLPQHFRSLGVGFHWIDAPLLWHERHDLGWSHAEWMLGRDYLASQYGNAPVYGSPAFREGLSRW